ncbi:maleylpyruvate isomerase family mycothiol-dependent enzyme [Allokutzneria multivorans]|uniref:Maleylpyruvate isomerase family mycothiol-dependent enzyme n=1 Tax=Allokutzneria multivorans TaxID=1142134 RepID=A0ABP7QNH9_9PSEU
MAQAHRRLRDALTDLTDAQAAAPSSLPGWTRGHVLAHLADAARARTRVIEHALRGQVVPLWQPGERDAIIAATASRSADEHRAAIEETSAHLDHAWAGINDWSAPDLAPAVFTRWREVRIHLVDLDLGVTTASWDPAFSCHAIDLLRRRLPDGWSLRATDTARTWGTGTEISAAASDLAAWLAGRAPAALPVATPLPPLGPWPSY